MISNLQKPIYSGFGAQTTAKEVLKNCNLNGKIAIVTGGYSGIGLETTRALAEAGATVIVPARTRDKASKLINEVPNIELEKLDLMDPSSIDAFAQRFIESGRPLNILINNAGIMAPPLIRDARGYESQFSTNHLGHFQLVGRLLPALKKAGNSRVVSLSSSGIRFGGVDFDDPNFIKHDYNKWKAYGQSKSANALFAIELDKKGKKYGIRGFAVHPGRVITDLIRFMSDNEKRGVANASAKSEFKTVEQGAATSVWCATSPQLDGKGGVYCLDVDIANLINVDDPTKIQGKLMDIVEGVFPWAVDMELADRLWMISEKMTGVKYDF